ncbi:MAG: alkaline phosphatase family protein [Flavobacteriales bacterium]|nr:alkaline phosphatase family protein [Flavobacteriales bacterium]
MKLSYILSLLIILFLASCQTDALYCGDVNQGSLPDTISLIAFGSCPNQNAGLPVLDKVADLNPDIFCWLGDNIYGDTHDMKVLQRKYSALGCRPEFRSLNQKTHFLAVWDDHDYGQNDAGKEYSQKEASKNIFLDFWGEPLNSERWNHSGNYHSETFGPIAQRVQFIMLDTRTFRDPLLLNDGAPWKNAYRPNEDSTVTMLGQEQWLWLEQTLLEPAEIRIVMSSIQFGIDYHGFEAWANMPHEKQRFLDLIASTHSEGVLIVSGDMHWAELSRIEHPNLYSIYDLTSSGITEEYSPVEPNSNRVGPAFNHANAGMIEIDWLQTDPDIRMYVIDVNGEVVINHQLQLSELKF